MLEIQPRIVDRCAYRVGEAEITPAAPHLFALLLALTLDAPGNWTRRGLQELLFGDVAERDASHRLRQLLYKLRSAGVSLAETTDGLIRIVNPVADPLGPLDETPGAPDGGGAGVVLPQYAPRLPAPFLDWLERRRDALQRASLTRRIAAVRAARERQDWRAAADLADLLQRQEHLTEELAEAGAEAHAMLGERDAAVAVIDHFVHESETPLTMYPQLRRLRTRILGTPLRHREGTLRGRQECLAFLAEQWRLATGGTGGRACAVFGPAGMGKSRVGETFVASARLAGAEVLVYRCDGQHRQFPLALFSQVIRDLRTRRGSLGADPALRAALDTVAPESAEPRPAAGDFEGRRDELRRAIVDLLEAVSAERPVLLVVDDAHLLDDASRAVIRSITESPNTAAVLIVLGCRPRPDDHTLVSSARRFATYTLPPLDAADSRALLLEVAAPQALSAAQLDWAVGHAGGNAFYLHALARHPCDDGSLPVHVRSLAQTGYLALSPDARTVLDVALLLDTLATPARVARASALPDRELMAALRELEDADLLMLEGGLLAGPHAIVRDALMELSPVAARGIMHRRIGAMLAEECEDSKRARLVAWAAVNSWVEAGEVDSAVELALRVARDAERVGEPEVGAIALSQIPRRGLATDRVRCILDAIITLASTGKCLTLLADAYKEREKIAISENEGANTISQLRIHTVASALPHLDDESTMSLRAILADTAIGKPMRCDAASRLIAIADLSYDQDLAADTHKLLCEFSVDKLAHDPSAVEANLVYHTTFGDRACAEEHIRQQLRRFPTASRDERQNRYRFNCMLALYRLGHYRITGNLLMQEWEDMTTQSNLGAAERTASLAADCYIGLGELEQAREIVVRYAAELVKRATPATTRSTAAYSPKVFFLLADGEYEELDRLLTECEATQNTAQVPRIQGFTAALRLGSAISRKDSHNVASLHDAVHANFQRGKALGDQDLAATMLWQSLTADNRSDEATKLLRDYLTTRRELGPPSWFLRTRTSVDRMWHERAIEVSVASERSRF